MGQESVALTPKEFELLALLTEDPGAVYSRQQILDRVWDPHYQGPTKTLDVHVATLRRKLGNPAWIQTLRGVGFRLSVHTAFPDAPQASTPPAYEPSPSPYEPSPAPYEPPTAYEPPPSYPHQSHDFTRTHQFDQPDQSPHHTAAYR